MLPWFRRRYYCTNTTGQCAHALADRPFRQAEFDAFGGACPASDHGCGQPLKAGDPLDLRLQWVGGAAAALACLGGGAWLLRILVFPPPLQHVHFVTPKAQVEDSAGLVQIEVVRDGDLDRTQDVHFSVQDGSAHNGEDYRSEAGTLTFDAGVRSRKLTLTVLPDRSFQKPVRFFTVTLTNVNGTPHQLIEIQPPVQAHSDGLLAEQAVRAASVVAKDIADATVRLRVITELLGASGISEGERRLYQRKQSDNTANLMRARESYLSMIRDLRGQSSGLVLDAMDRVSQDLVRQGFLQQGKAVSIMKRQFVELLDHQAPDMDRWAGELATVIPRPDSRNGGDPRT